MSEFNWQAIDSLVNLARACYSRCEIGLRAPDQMDLKKSAVDWQIEGDEALRSACEIAAEATVGRGTVSIGKTSDGRERYLEP